jgi:membrane-bound ClpP family serine protease
MASPTTPLGADQVPRPIEATKKKKTRTIRKEEAKLRTDGKEEGRRDTYASSCHY